MADLQGGLELIRCAQINVENMVKTMPSLALHPYLAIVKMQIEGAIDALESPDPLPAPGTSEGEPE